MGGGGPGLSDGSGGESEVDKERGERGQVDACAREHGSHRARLHISSGIATERRAAYFDDKQHGRDLSAAQQIRWRDRGEEEEEGRGREGESCEER